MPDPYIPPDPIIAALTGTANPATNTLINPFSVSSSVFPPPPIEPMIPSITSIEEPKQPLVITENLDNPEWWNGPNSGVVGNPHLKRIPAPVTFKVMLNELSPSDYLPNPKTGKPLEIRLNCSLSQIQHKMKHILNKANSRTGFHLTFWGLEPDTISGSGSTGVFMNHFGVTHMMSTNTSDYNSDIYAAFSRGRDISNLLDVGNSTLPQLRVAAQDAFIELLSLFKNNGIVRFMPQNYSGQFEQRTQMGEGQFGPMWSSQSGGSTFEQSMRNNDVMAKGQVFMTFQGNIYQGYFKTFSWTIDADSPFHWKFDFSFQVQRSLSFVYYNY